VRAADLRPRVCAHRGGAGSAPENTLAACRRALEAGVEWVEVDVRFTADRVPVLLHDDTVDRTTDGRGRIRQLRWRELRQLDAGSWFSPAFRGERVPSLEELLQLLSRFPHAGAYVEIKEEGEEGEHLAEAVVELASEGGLLQRLRVASFFEAPLQRVHQLRPQAVPVALQDPLEFRDPVRFVRERGTGVWGPHHAAVNRERLQVLHRAGVGVYAWTVNDPPRAVQLWRWGLGQHPEDAVATDFPEPVRAALDSPREGGG